MRSTGLENRIVAHVFVSVAIAGEQPRGVTSETAERSQSFYCLTSEGNNVRCGHALQQGFEPRYGDPELAFSGFFEKLI